MPFGELQRQITLSVPGPLRVVIYRRMMFRIAERIARTRGAQALVTGEVVGQVASQTIENLTAIEGASTLPVFRPLIGMDKEEITAQAEKLGSYPISIIPDEDCCTLFTPRHPATHARRAEIDEAERTLPIDRDGRRCCCGHRARAVSLSGKACARDQPGGGATLSACGIGGRIVVLEG